MECKLVENVIKIFLWIQCWQKQFSKTQIWKDTFQCLFTWEWIKQILLWNYSMYDLWNLKLSYLNQLQWIIVIGSNYLINMCRSCNGAMVVETLFGSSTNPCKAKHWHETVFLQFNWSFIQLKGNVLCSNFGHSSFSSLFSLLSCFLSPSSQTIGVFGNNLGHAWEQLVDQYGNMTWVWRYFIG
jgi:hypothetical protein